MTLAMLREAQTYLTYTRHAFERLDEECLRLLVNTTVESLWKNDMQARVE